MLKNNEISGKSDKNACIMDSQWTDKAENMQDWKGSTSGNLKSHMYIQ